MAGGYIEFAERKPLPEFAHMPVRARSPAALTLLDRHMFLALLSALKLLYHLIVK